MSISFRTLRFLPDIHIFSLNAVASTLIVGSVLNVDRWFLCFELLLCSHRHTGPLNKTKSLSISVIATLKTVNLDVIGACMVYARGQKFRVLHILQKKHGLLLYMKYRFGTVGTAQRGTKLSDCHCQVYVKYVSLTLTSFTQGIEGTWETAWRQKRDALLLRVVT